MNVDNNIKSTMTCNKESDIIDAIKELLAKNGDLNKIQAEIRAKVTDALQAKQLELQADAPPEPPPPTPSQEIQLVNQLLMEYLEWSGYLYTGSVLTSEAGLTAERKSRSDLCAEVGVKDDERSATLPLLLNIVAAYTERIKRKLSKKNVIA